MKGTVSRFLVAFFQVFCAVTSRGAGAPTEYDVKAAFIYNFAQYVQWPAVGDSNRPFVIGLIGRDPFGRSLDEAMHGLNVEHRPIVIRRFTKVEEIANSDILFISSSERDNLPRILTFLRRAPVLTVADMDRFAEQGGMINLVTERNRVRFDVNPLAIERTGLKAGSQIMRLARIVTDTRAGSAR
jgi:hypothetical protein